MSDSKAKVLIVDDDPQIVAFVAALLEDEGYLVQVAHNGEEALTRATETLPDLILLDLRMPIMDGWTCCRRLRHQQKTVNIPIIVMSADGIGTAVRADLDVEHFLSKPFDAADLLRCVETSRYSAMS